MKRRHRSSASAGIRSASWAASTPHTFQAAAAVEVAGDTEGVYFREGGLDPAVGDAADEEAEAGPAVTRAAAADAPVGLVEGAGAVVLKVADCVALPTSTAGAATLA